MGAEGLAPLSILQLDVKQRIRVFGIVSENSGFPKLELAFFEIGIWILYRTLFRHFLCRKLAGSVHKFYHESTGEQV